MPILLPRQASNDRRRMPSRWSPGINRDHWQAKGLVAWYPLVSVDLPQQEYIIGNAPALKNGSGQVAQPILLGGLGWRFPDNTFLRTTANVNHNIGTGAFTFATWVYRVSESAESYQGYYGNGVFAPGLYTEVNGGSWGMYWGGNNQADGANLLGNGQWWHLVARRTGTTVEFFKNAKKEPGSYTIGTSMSNAVQSINNQGTAAETDSILTDHRLYSRALCDAEIFALYNPPTRWDLYPQPRFPWGAIAGGAAPPAGLDIPIAMHHYKQLMGAN